MNASVLILGGGFGGWAAAERIRAGLPDGAKVTLVDRTEHPHLGLSLLWLMTGERGCDRIWRPLPRLRSIGVDFVKGRIERIDPERREVQIRGKSLETLSADYMVVALGAELAPETIPGLAEGGCDFYTPVGAEALRDRLATFAGGTIVVLTAAPAYKCPPAPYEAAMLLESACRARGLRDKTRVEFYAAEAAPMMAAGPAVSAAVRSLIESKGIGYHPGRQAAEVDPQKRLVRFADGTECNYDLLAYVPPHRAPKVVRESPLAGQGGWIEVDRKTLATCFERVYAVGDVATIPLSIGKPLPKAGVFAEGEARVVAGNIVREIAGTGEPAVFDGRGGCYVELGDGLAAYGEGDFYAEPAPQVVLHSPAAGWHKAKIRLEAEWLDAGLSPADRSRRVA